MSLSGQTPPSTAKRESARRGETDKASAPALTFTRTYANVHAFVLGQQAKQLLAEIANLTPEAIGAVIAEIGQREHVGKADGFTFTCAACEARDKAAAERAGKAS